MTALRVTPPTGGNMQREHTDCPSSKRREEGKRKNKRHWINVCGQDLVYCWAITVSLANSVFSAWWRVARVLGAASVGISLVTRRTAAYLVSISIDDLPISNHQSPLTALLPVDLHWAWAPQGEGTQGSWGTGALSRRTPTAETGPLRRLLTTVRWAEGWEILIGQPSRENIMMLVISEILIDLMPGVIFTTSPHNHYHLSLTHLQ